MKDHAENIMGLLRRIIHAVSIHSKKISSEYKLTLPQLIILRELERAGDVSIGELARKASLSAATVSSIIDRLADKRLVKRRRPETDRRKVYVYLTESANDALEKAPSLLNEEFENRIEAMNENEKERLYSSLRKIADMMNA